MAALFLAKSRRYGGCSVCDGFVTTLETIKSLAAGLSFAGAQ
jgi:hypothetical protein